jgi:hypothetical protein
MVFLCTAKATPLEFLIFGAILYLTTLTSNFLFGNPTNAILPFH